MEITISQKINAIVISNDITLLMKRVTIKANINIPKDITRETSVTGNPDHLKYLKRD
jgi:hypothetical protein